MRNLKNVLNENLSEDKQVEQVVNIIKNVFINWEDEKGNDKYSHKLGDFTWKILDAIYVDGENVGALDDIESWLNEQTK